MSESSQSVNDFFEVYEDLAIAVIDDERPNLDIGLELSNSEMAEVVCELMEWESFDLFQTMDFLDIYNRGGSPQVLSYCYMAFLRWELWLAAINQKIGDAAFNEQACADSELWYCRLRDRYAAMVNGEMVDHVWLQ